MARSSARKKGHRKGHKRHHKGSGPKAKIASAIKLLQGAKKSC